MERTPTLHRRRLLAVAGSTAALAVTAGCMSSGDDDDSDDSNESDNSSDDPDDAEADADDQDDDETESDDDDSAETAEENESNDTDSESVVDADAVADYETETHDGTEVPLVPLEDAASWYDSGDVHFVDTRGGYDFTETHIRGAIWSPADEGLDEDPVDDLDQDSVLVTYCACPHSIAVRRGATLLEEGYENVFVLEGGLDAWLDEDLPIEGGAVD